MLFKPVVTTSYAVLVGVVWYFAVPLSVADDTIASELQRCGSIDDGSLRLACYDMLSGRQGMAQESPVTPAEPSLDNLGSESLPRDKKDEVETLAIQARVTRCAKNSLKKYFFYFENGQVWKQVSGKRLYFKNCDFNVTITKDYFGYKMQQEGEKARIRISRVK